MNWIEREITRLADGTYQPLPEVLQKTLHFPNDHFVHLSTSETETDHVAYTPSEAYGIADRQVRLKFGRYLKKTFPQLTDAEIQAHVTSLKSAVAVKAIEAVEMPVTLKFATDRETINRIFETEMYACGSSCSSCMHGKFDGDEIRPYHVYADSPDVAVAYVETSKGIVSRSVVSTRNMDWVRCYSVANGDNDADCGVLKQLLKDAGYTKGDLIGNRLTKLPETRKGVMLPYIDNGGAHVRDDGDYWLVVDDGEGEYAADCTDGTATETDDRDRCECCDEPTEDCECHRCDCCETLSRDGCDECSMCQECDGCMQHHGCDCDRCSECHEIISPANRYTDSCSCDRCEGCNELPDDCTCESDEEEVPDEEEVSDDSDTVSDLGDLIEPDPLVLTVEQVKEKLNRIYTYLRDVRGEQPTSDTVISPWSVLRKAAHSVIGMTFDGRRFVTAESTEEVRA